jgi:hypothetical protein
MYVANLLPDFTKLKSYFPDLTEEHFNQIKTNNGVDLHLDYLDELSYTNVSGGLKLMCDKYGMQEHYVELLYLIVKKNEEIRIKYVTLWENYNADQTAREVAQLLLAYKESNPNQHFQLAARSLTKSISIRNTPIARWMAELIYNAVEKQDFPLELFGHQIMSHLFGDNPFDVDKISMERLKVAAAITCRKPTTKLTKLYVEFCLYIQTYLINQTHLVLPASVMLTDAHANFYFDMLELFNYVSKEKIQSEPKDYIHSMFRNKLR